MANSSTPPKPRGRDEVRSAVLTATSDLVAERGPDGFSVRDIAARAGVNHALVHRHFGTKADVLEEMLAADAEAVVAAVIASGLPTSGVAGADVVEDLLELLATRPSYWRTLVNAVLDTPEVALPGTASTTELFSGLWREAEGAGSVPTAVAGMTVLGWLIFGRFMNEATGADASETRHAIAEQVADLISSQR